MQKKFQDTHDCSELPPPFPQSQICFLKIILQGTIYDVSSADEVDI